MSLAPKIADLTLLRRIGHGSYGDVWIARTITGIYRAVKVVARARFEDERPFLRELDGITRFQQAVGDRPRQLALMHVGRDDAAGLFYYVMELADDAVTGTDIDPDRYVPLTLKEYMRRGPVPAPDVVRLGIELAQVLVELHTEGLIHRDVKPSNIIFVGGMPKLADIGLVSSSDHTLTSLGTPGYSPPEGAGTAKADIYSLGKILYQLVTGMTPQDFPRLPSDLMSREDADAVIELNEVVLRACDPEPNRRYSTAQKLLDDLLLLQAGKSVRELHRMRRHLKLLGRMSAVAAIIALIAVGALGWANYKKARELAAQERTAREQAEHDERLARYSADLNVAQLAITSGDYGVARTALRRQIPAAGEPDLRGLEWWAMWNDTEGDAIETYGEIGASGWRIVLPSPDGKSIALQNLAGETYIGERGSNQRRLLATGTNGLGGFSADGARLLIGTQDRKVRWVNVATGTAEPNLPVTGRLLGIGDGIRIVLGERVGNGVQLLVWDLARSNELGRWESGERQQELQLGGAAISSDGGLLAICLFWSEGTVTESELIVWNLTEQRVVARSTDVERVHAVRFSPDGAFIAVGMADRPVHIFRSDTAEIHARLEGHVGPVTAIAFSAESGVLATAGRDQTIRLWNVEEATSRVFSGHEGSVLSLTFENQTSTLFSGSADGTWRRWDAIKVANRKETDGLWAGVLGDVAFIPDESKIVATGKDGELLVLNAASLEVTGRIPGIFQPLVFEGSTVLGLSRDLQLVSGDLETGDVQRRGLAIEGMNHVAILVRGGGGSRAMFGFRHGEVELWDLAAVRSFGRQKRHEGAVEALALSSDGARAVSGDTTGSVWLWSGLTGAAERELKRLDQPITVLAFTADTNYVLAGTRTGEIHVIDRESGRTISELRGHGRHVTSIIHILDGARIVSAGNDGFVNVWTFPELRPIASLLAVTDSEVRNRGIYRINFSPRVSQLVAVTEDGHLRRWRSAIAD